MDSEEDGISTYRIAEKVKLDRQRITRILRREGVTIAQRGSGRSKSLRVVDGLSEETLRDLYIDRWMSSIEIGCAFGISDRFVRSRLTLSGIDRRTRGDFDRHDRTDVSSNNSEVDTSTKTWRHLTWVNNSVYRVASYCKLPIVMESKCEPEDRLVRRKYSTSS